jgi:hypothetical protein
MHATATPPELTDVQSYPMHLRDAQRIRRSRTELDIVAVWTGQPVQQDSVLRRTVGVSLELQPRGRKRPDIILRGVVISDVDSRLRLPTRQSFVARPEWTLHSSRDF